MDILQRPLLAVDSLSSYKPMLVSSAIASNYFIFCWSALVAYNFYESESFFHWFMCLEYWSFVMTAFIEHSGLTSSNIQLFILVIQDIFNPLPTLEFQGIDISSLGLTDAPVFRYIFYSWKYLSLITIQSSKMPILYFYFFIFSPLFLVLQCCPELLPNAWS